MTIETKESTLQTTVNSSTFLDNFLANPAKVFLIIGGLFGLLFIAIIPPFQVPDEYHHFYRAYQISEFQFVSQKVGGFSGGNIPESLLETLTNLYPWRKEAIENFPKMLTLPLARENTIFKNFAGAALYTPIPYLPQAIGINIGKTLNFSPLILFYLGRVFNLLVSIWLIYLAIKITPVFKWVFFLLALMPVATQEMVSLSSDSFTNSIAFLFIALILRYAFEKEQKLDKKALLLLIGVSVLLTLSKQAYLPLIFLFILIPIWKFGSLKKYLTFGFGLLLLNIILLAVWSYIALSVYALDSITSGVGVNNVSPSEQLKFVLSNPFKFVLVLVNNFLNESVYYFQLFWGDLGWPYINTKLPSIISVFYALFILLIAMVEYNERIQIGLGSRLKILGVFIGGVITVNALAYLSWNPVGSEVLWGIQGRYYIPLAPLPYFLFYNLKLPNSTFLSLLKKRKASLSLTVSACFLCVALYVLILRHYVAIPEYDSETIIRLIGK